MNKKEYAIIAISLIVVLAIFYWFEWRPSQIKQKCSTEARLNISSDTQTNNTKRKEIINTYYNDCLIKFGLK